MEFDRKERIIIDILNHGFLTSNSNPITLAKKILKKLNKEYKTTKR